MRSIARSGYLAFGIASYLAFLSTILYAIGFVGNFWETLGLRGDHWRSLDAGKSPAGLVEGLLVDGALLGLFAVQHSVMARQGFKRIWTELVPPALERSVFVLVASVCLASGTSFMMTAEAPVGRRTDASKLAIKHVFEFMCHMKALNVPTGF